MKFYYQPTVTLSPETGEPALVLRPEISIRVIGPTGGGVFRALVDTGADNTILPMSVAEVCGIPTELGVGPQMEAYGGQKIPTRFGDVAFELSEDDDVVRWKTRVQFFDFATPDGEALILGHSGVLDFFTANFDGQEAVLTLTANDELPAFDD